MFTASAPLPPSLVPPREEHPLQTSLGFFEALAWCVVFILFTQFPGAVVAIVVLILVTMVAPDMLPQEALNNVQDMMNSPGMSVALASAMGATQVLVIGFSWMVIRLLYGPTWPRQLSLRLPAGRHVLLALISLPAMWLMGNVSYGVVRWFLPSIKDVMEGSGVEEMTKLFSSWPWPLGVLIIGLGPGIGEELWCRGFLGRGLVGRYGVVLGVVFSSFFFGLIHLDPCQGAMAMLLGLWLHYVYLTTRSLYVPMLLHFLNNTLSVLTPRFTGLEALDRPPEELPRALIASAVALLLLVAWALYQSRARLQWPTGHRTDWPAGEQPAPASGLTVVSSPLGLVPLVGVVLGVVAFGSALGWTMSR
jgi:membrane protease YdiL (CAAX protease family)